MHHALVAESEHSDDRLRLALQTPPALNYALAHNRVPIVRRLVVHNLTDDDLGDLDVTVELTGPQGVLAGPWQRKITNLSAGRDAAFTDFGDFVPDVSMLAAADEAFPVYYRVRVEHGGAATTELQASSEVLAHNEWFNSPALYDSIAAFVQPNTSSVSHILRQAARLLEQQTGSSHIEGYQSGPERATLIAGAIYEALRGESIAYVTMPASFEDTGQKVRTSAGVLAERLGNCIDLSVSYAACLEAAGLHALIFVTRTHAFAGFFRQDTRLPETVSLDPNHLVNLAGSTLVVPVELTNIGPGTGSMTFEQAADAGMKHLRVVHDDLRGVVDIHAAQRSGIKPLPSGDRQSEEPATVGEQDDRAPRIGLSQQLAGIVPLTDERSESNTLSGGAPGQDGAPPRVAQWRNNLLDLSLRNPLLKLPARGKGLDLHVPPDALPKLDDLIHENKPITVIAQDMISGVHKLAGTQRAQDLDDEILVDELDTDHRVYGNVNEQKYVAKMRTLQREARTVLQETGGNFLYLTLGALVHTSNTGAARAPLFLLPVRIEGGTGHKPYSIVADGDEIAAANYCLIEWLRVHHGLRIPELANPSTDESGIDIVKSLARIRQSLVENNLHYRIESTASLRLLQFSTFQMWRDLTNHWEMIQQNPVVRHLVDKPGDRFVDPNATADVDVDESALHLPIPADGSQMKAIAMAAQDRSFVLEGPPGTGKSQTITNLIAHTIASGKKVLFVAEKQAALDVVKRRLSSIGFDPFCLDLHGRKQSLPNIHKQLKESLDHDLAPDGHRWRAAETAFRKRLDALRRHPQRVHGTNPAGYSAWSAYEAVLAHGEGPMADVPRSFFSLQDEQRNAVEHAARELPTVLDSARVRPDHPWRISGLRDASARDAEQFQGTVRQLETARSALHGLPANLASVIGDLRGPGELASTLDAAHLAAQGYPADDASTAPTIQPGWDASFTSAYQALQHFRAQHEHVVGALRPELFEHSELDAWYAEADAARRSMLPRKKKLRTIAERLRPYAHPETSVDENAVHDLLTAAKAAREAAAEVMQQVAHVRGLQLPPQWRPTHTHAVQAMETAHRCALMWRDVRMNQPELAAVYAKLATQLPLADLRLITESWRRWLTTLATTNVEYERWRNGQPWTSAWDRDGAAWAEDAERQGLTRPHRWGAVLTQLDVLDSAGLSAFSSQIVNGAISAPEAEEAFQRGVARSALNERLASSELDLFDGAAHTHEVNEYLGAGQRLREHVPEWLAGKLLDNRPPVSTDKSSSNGELVRQLERKRGGLSFRELLRRYPDTITGLMPCFLMSPASVANFLEPGGVEFDLVVFDEASQIRVAEAVGAMGRARSVVVVGDSKQMPPTSLMEVNRGDDESEDDDADATPEDMDSILSECVESGLPQIWLSWHYRSCDESLIAFSNSHYYEDQLASLPSPGSGPHSGVSARRVQGVFDRGASRTNETEATAIVDEIGRILADPDTSGRSVGVVTFNVQQRDLLLNLLEDSEDPLVQAALARTDDEALFVKNLENVQGDERDVVLFSLAFSTDPATGQLPMNFGPLLRDGGERRLNVAITRARSQVILFSSFDPLDLDLNRTKSVGVRHLREYLEMAYSAASAETGQQRSVRQGAALNEIAVALRERGYEVAPRFGLSHFTVDLAVRAAGAEYWQVAVIADGPDWARRPTVADRDAAPELLTRIMRWPAVVRVWLASWINDREAVLAEIDSAVANAAVAHAAVAHAAVAHAEPSREAPPEVVAETQKEGVDSPAVVDAERSGEREHGEVVDPVPVAAEVSSPETSPVESLADAVAQSVSADSLLADEGSTGPEPFKPYVPTVLGTQEQLNQVERDPAVQRTVRSAFVEIAEFEGPIEQGRLAKLVLERFEFDRGRSSRVQSVLRYLPPNLLVRKSKLGVFVWPADLDPVTWRGFRKSATDGERKLEEIAPEEIANAMCWALVQHRGIRSDDELYKQALALLGFAPPRGEPKLTKARRQILWQAESFGVADGRLSEAKYDRKPGEQ